MVKCRFSHLVPCDLVSILIIDSLINISSSHQITRERLSSLPAH